MLRLMFNLNTAMMPAGLCTMGVTLFLKEHSQFPPPLTFLLVIYCPEFMLHTLLLTIMNEKSCENAGAGNPPRKITGLNLRTTNEF